ncbi:MULTISPECIES: hypothetical protein [unclassified Rathayibacter]|uniref:hypothetical protein n=1 Tax=unclassified Rathayibacter TaxID=2609250 RepID=UPI001FB39599|nr:MULTISPECIES: hypothetical protein [unclassified Rathayibacter]MCJ1683602.1 hypothetical protein [Rathayibacter sp. VKM Ac-2928]MCJ1688863.1 hypothetical protein [Rathayibacter sp. VKM Ac-2927]
MSPLSRTARTAAIAAIALLLTGLAASPAQAKTSSVGGDYSVTVNGTTYDPAAGKDVKLKDVAVSGTIAVRGVNNRFDLRVSTLGVYDYTLTGAPDTQRMVTSPTVVFASKVPTLTAAQLAGARLDSLEVKDDTLVVILRTAAGKLKVQAKDGAQGGIFQMEPEFAGNVELVHTLGPGLFYFVNSFTGKINFGIGVDAVTPAQSATGYHSMLLGKDSPQVATKTFQSGTVTKWTVASGGRLGGVLGEDAVELSQGATNCTSQCQAQNRINGSLPVPPDPVNPTPIG